MTDFKEVRTTHEDPSKKGRNTTFKLTQVIWLLLGFLESVLALRFLFKLIGVNPANSFATLLYGFTNLFVAPFANLTGTPSAEGMVFEFTTLIAMLVYALVFYGLERLVYVIFYRERGPVNVKQTVVTDHTPADTHTTTQVSKTTTTDQSDTQENHL
ncbi:MAG: YggT family protein [Anaerolineaceae bacterium]|nr:YggT family protein [Anaerolineaceae bacterium]